MDMDCLKPIAGGDTQELLKQAAKGELLLYVALHPFTAKLQARNWAKEPKQSECINKAGKLVPLNPVAAKTLTMFTEANITWFEPEGSWEEGNHYHDHVWFLDKPQTVPREQVYFEAGAKQSTEHTEVQKRQVELIEKVRELMQKQHDRGDKVNRMQALKDLQASGELRRLDYSGNNVLQKCRKLTDPNQVEKLGLKALPR